MGSGCLQHSSGKSGAFGSAEAGKLVLQLASGNMASQLKGSGKNLSEDAARPMQVNNPDASSFCSLRN